VRKFFLVLFFIACVPGLFAQKENLTVKLAVIGPGDELYYWWGHIALVIEDSNKGESYFYDYGIFDFNQENFFYNFAVGRLLYYCGVSSAEIIYNIYRKTNRDIIIYTLDLPPETKIKVRDFAGNNVLPENRDYFYHHFKDNCSTRIRDIIDMAVNGQFMEKYKNEESRFTLREHVRRHTWFSPLADWALSFLMGQVIDTKITVWEDMFLPSEAGIRAEEFYYTDENGETRKLVSSKEILYTSKNRPAVLDKPRVQWPYELIFGLALSLIFAFFFYLQAKNIRAGKILAGISMSAVGLFFGIMGTLLYFMALFTDHDYIYQNFNMLFCTPLFLVTVPAGICYAITDKQEKLKKYSSLLRLIWLLCAGGIIISMLIKILPWFYQDNLTDQLLMLPLALVFICQSSGLKGILAKRSIYGRK